ncbi:hypothetical protein PIB30_093740 [Stylosanthes scabra]|uniref:Uncharacterized protein n=1 Tax=Stylosanthes scabra TaxID=79078 RepID=A0ABU6UU38_9FABA|nr:hypothetical protein [Stylosanthes scabra]
MANMSKNQTEFDDSMLAQQTAYGLRLQEMETRQEKMWQFQQEAWQAQHQFQQEKSNQNLVRMIPTKIPPAIRDNFKAGRPLFHWMLRPWPPEGSSNTLGQQATPAVNVPRNPNAIADDED